MRVRLQSKEAEINKIFQIPGDKSISHRALIIGALGKGGYNIENFPQSLDCLSTVECMKSLGVKIELNGSNVRVISPGYSNFIKFPELLNANNSGTTARLLSGLAVGCGVETFIDGDESLRSRPMDRVIVPLKLMGANIESSKGSLPISLKNTQLLKGIEYKMPIDSAQVKSCILIAGFMAEGETKVIENNYTRDHTERMFKALGCNIDINGKIIKIKNSAIETKNMYIPGDISSAAFLIACALLSEKASIKLENMLLNERRRKYLDVLRQMGADIEYKVTNIVNYEEIGYITAKSSSLNGITIQREDIPNVIDEIPILSVLAAFSNGITVMEGIGELKHKESNRIKAIAENLINCGIDIEHTENFIKISGYNNKIKKQLNINPYNDHRIALAFAALSVRNLGETIIDNWECTEISFPNSLEYFKEFANILTHL